MKLISNNGKNVTSFKIVVGGLFFLVDVSLIFLILVVSMYVTFVCGVNLLISQRTL